MARFGLAAFAHRDFVQLRGQSHHRLGCVLVCQTQDEHCIDDKARDRRFGGDAGGDSYMGGIPSIPIWTPICSTVNSHFRRRGGNLHLGTLASLE